MISESAFIFLFFKVDFLQFLTGKLLGKLRAHKKMKSVKVEKADLTCDVIKKVALFVLSKL